MLNIKNNLDFGVNNNALVPIDANFVDMPKKTEITEIVVVDKEFEEMYDYIRPHEARLLIESTDTPRNHLLLNVLWQTGGRVSEVLKLRPVDITDPGILMVTLKKRESKKKRTSSGKWVLRKTPVVINSVARRSIPIKAELRAEIHKFAFDSRMKPDDLFFPVTSRRVQQILDELAGKTNITYKKLHPHLFRHGFAVNWINQGGTLHKLQKILGHNHIQTTMVYLKLVDSDLKRDFERMVF